MRDGPSSRRWSRIFRPEPRREVDEELAFHLEQRARDYEARGMTPEGARAAAAARLGDLGEVREECTVLLTEERRAEARRHLMKISLLDLKLGVRMLLKYPVLTVVGGIAIAFAVWVGAGAFEIVSQVAYPRLPLAAGERVVAVENWDAALGRVDRRVLHDLVQWRESLRSVERIGAWRTTQRNLVAPGVALEPVEVAEMSASGFGVAGVPALLGRTLTPEDERPGAESVVVIGHGVWQDRFGGDRGVVGREIRLGSTVHTIVGVMPDGYGFPVSQDIWTPLRLNPLEHPRGSGPGLRVFGLLAEGASLEDAQAELDAFGQRMAADHPDTHARLRPRVLPLAESVFRLSGIVSLGLMSLNLFVVVLLVLVCGNVALLMFARAASRENEIVVRNALGASRGRIIAQLFTEALVLAVVGAAVGLAATKYGLRWAISSLGGEVLDGRVPFWIDESLSAETYIYAVLLTLMAATVAGVVPALKVTRGLATRLRQASAGGGGFRFGGVWTTLIVMQIAATVVFPFIAYATKAEAAGYRSRQATFPAYEYLAVRLQLDRASLVEEGADTSEAGIGARYNRTLAELERRLEAEPAVAGVTFAERLPLAYHPHRRIELDEGGAAPPEPHFGYYRVSSAEVQLDFFDVFDAPVIAGRGLHSGDLASDARAVVVNEAYVERVLGGHNAVGRRLRYYHYEELEDNEPAANAPWYEIVGVVKDIDVTGDEFDPKSARVYHAVRPADAYPMQMAVRMRGSADTFAPRLRVLAASLDPSVQLHQLTRLDRVNDADVRLVNFWFWLVVVLSAVALLISLSGIYAVMAFTVSQRTREIGVRIALGADARRIVAAIFRRPLKQVGLGVLVGALIIAGMLGLAQEGIPSLRHIAVVLVYSGAALCVCLLACVVPTRRALSVQPTEALRAEV